jgi:hypothetical protein
MSTLGINLKMNNKLSQSKGVLHNLEIHQPTAKVLLSEDSNIFESANIRLYGKK